MLRPDLWRRSRDRTEARLRTAGVEVPSPGGPSGIVARTALVDRLTAAQAPVITVVAPPGYGKTTLLAQWAERIGPRVAWVSCDDADNDPSCC